MIDPTAWRQRRGRLADTLAWVLLYACIGVFLYTCTVAQVEARKCRRHCANAGTGEGDSHYLPPTRSSPVSRCWCGNESSRDAVRGDSL